MYTKLFLSVWKGSFRFSFKKKSFFLFLFQWIFPSFKKKASFYPQEEKGFLCPFKRKLSLFLWWESFLSLFKEKGFSFPLGRKNLPFSKKLFALLLDSKFVFQTKISKTKKQDKTRQDKTRQNNTRHIKNKNKSKNKHIFPKHQNHAK